jgi:hypothetical protein
MNLVLHQQAKQALTASRQLVYHKFEEEAINELAL